MSSLSSPFSVITERHHILIVFWISFCFSVRTKSKLIAWYSFLAVPRSSCFTCWRFAARNNKIIDYRNIIIFSSVYCVLWSSKWPQWGRIFCICLHPSGRNMSSYPLSPESFLPLFHEEEFEDFFSFNNVQVPVCQSFHMIVAFKWVIFMLSLHVESVFSVMHVDKVFENDPQKLTLSYSNVDLSSKFCVGVSSSYILGMNILHKHGIFLSIA